MKRLIVLLSVFTYCTVAIAQHPYSKGGNPLYWALVGGISAGLYYAIFRGIPFIMSLFKRRENNNENDDKPLNNDEGFKDDQSLNSVPSRVIYSDNNCSKTQKEPCHDKPDKCNESMKRQFVMYCKHCGKEIDADSPYCRYCGKKQNKRKMLSIPILSLPNKESWRRFLRRSLNWVFVCAICFSIGCLICLCIGDDAVDANPFKGWGYILPPFIAYLIYRIITFAYSLKGKKKTILAVILAIFAATFMGLEVYFTLNYEAQLEQEYQSNTPENINRSFLGCSFGDPFELAGKSLSDRGLNPQDIISEDGNRRWLISNTKYGKYNVDTICFSFYKDKLFNVWISINTIDFDDYLHNYTYQSLRDLLEDKYSYRRDYTHNYKNSLTYSDDSTEIKLWHKANDAGYEKYSVTLNYYDKTSGFREERDNVF